MFGKSRWNKLLPGACICFQLALNLACGGNNTTRSAVHSGSTESTENAPFIQISATPSSINTGQFARIKWDIKKATSVSFSPELPIEDQQVPLSGSTMISPSRTTTYTATATGPGGVSSASVTITVVQGAPLIVFSATPNLITPGESALLAWHVENATAVTITNVGSVSVLSGSLSVSPVQTVTYMATATGPAGTASASATVRVTATRFSATPGFISAGQSSALSWVSSDAASITLDNGIGGVSVPSGSLSVSPGSTTRYTATVVRANGSSYAVSTTLVVSHFGSGLEKIKHIIFYVQENRSFDNYFGMLGEYRLMKGLPSEIDGLPGNVALRDKSSNLIHPYHYVTACTEGPSPGWGQSHQDVNGGRMDNFLLTRHDPFQFDPNGEFIMGHYDQRDLPYYYELATQFATSDRWFAPVLAGTIPNRMYLFSGTSQGHAYADPTVAIGQFKWPTIFDSMDDAGVRWRYYYQDNSAFLPQWATWTKKGGVDQGKVRPISEWYSILSDPNADDLLAPVVFIERDSSGLDEHPTRNVQVGAANTKHIIDALMRSAAWGSSVFILTYDEGGGFYDHVVPFAEPKPDGIPPVLSSTDIHAEFNESGFRVPLIVVSPWVKPHFVSHVNRDFTAILKFIETRFAIPPLTPRDASQHDLSDFFDFSHPAWMIPPRLPKQPVNLPCNKALESDPAQP